jgi:glutathione S-transferase
MVSSHYLSSTVLIIAALLHSSTALAASTTNTKKMMELKYFNARGAAETIRTILAITGEDYIDTRFEITPGTMNAPEFIKAKENGDLDMNLGRAPLLVTSEGVIGQSKAIERYLAKKFDLMGSSDIEAAQIDCIAEHCRDVKDAAGKKGFSSFNREKTEDEKAAARKEWFENDLPTMLEKVEKTISLTSGASGYAVGSKTSYADIAIFSLLKDCTFQQDAEDTVKAADKCTKLLEIANRIAGDEKVSKWIENRPQTMF